MVALEEGVIVQEVTALHVTAEWFPRADEYVSTSAQVKVLRKLLLGSHKGVGRAYGAAGY